MFPNDRFAPRPPPDWAQRAATSTHPLAAFYRSRNWVFAMDPGGAIHSSFESEYGTCVTQILHEPPPRDILWGFAELPFELEERHEADVFVLFNQLNLLVPTWSLSFQCPRAYLRVTSLPWPEPDWPDAFCERFEKLLQREVHRACGPLHSLVVEGRDLADVIAEFIPAPSPDPDSSRSPPSE